MWNIRQNIWWLPEGRRWERAKWVKGDPMNGDRWQLDFWWKAHFNVYRYRIIMLYTQDLYNVTNQCYLNLKKKRYLTFLKYAFSKTQAKI